MTQAQTTPRPAQPELAHPWPSAQMPGIRSAYEMGLASTRAAVVPTDEFGTSVQEAERRLSDLEAGKGGARPLVCRIVSDSEPPADILESISEEICEALEGVEDFDPYPLAAALFELGLFRPAVLLLERTIRLQGPGLRACELMARCLLSLERPDLALLWALRPMRHEDLELDSALELVRLASVCRMQLGSESTYAA